MDKNRLKEIRCTPIEELISEDFGSLGTKRRYAFEASCDAFIIREQKNISSSSVVNRSK